MSRGFPSMTALLGLLAVAGYQNRDKIAEVINGMAKGGPAPGGGAGLGALLGNLGASGPAGLLNGGAERACGSLHGKRTERCRRFLGRARPKQGAAT
jgi:hypothetical protein